MAANISFMFRPLQARPMREFQKENKGNKEKEVKEEEWIRVRVRKSDRLRQELSGRERGGKKEEENEEEKERERKTKIEIMDQKLIERNKDRESHKAIKR